MKGPSSFGDVIEEVDENLGSLVDALQAIAHPVSAREVAEEMGREGRKMKAVAVKRRLDHLAGGHAGVTRLLYATRGVAYVYAIEEGD